LIVSTFGVDIVSRAGCGHDRVSRPGNIVSWTSYPTGKPAIRARRAVYGYRGVRIIAILRPIGEAVAISIPCNIDLEDVHFSVRGIVQIPL
tara:strand:+ start:234 stop:506 length:273 start_codon:yes stop_codon:yes gene_type:complete